MTPGPCPAQPACPNHHSSHCRCKGLRDRTAHLAVTESCIICVSKEAEAGAVSHLALPDPQAHLNDLALTAGMCYMGLLRSWCHNNLCRFLLLSLLPLQGSVCAELDFLAFPPMLTFGELSILHGQSPTTQHLSPMHPAPRVQGWGHSFSLL